MVNEVGIEQSIYNLLYETKRLVVDSKEERIDMNPFLVTYLTDKLECVMDELENYILELESQTLTLLIDKQLKEIVSLLTEIRHHTITQTGYFRAIEKLIQEQGKTLNNIDFSG